MCARTCAGSLNVSIMVVPELSLWPCRVEGSVNPCDSRSGLAEADCNSNAVLTATVRVPHTHKLYKKEVVLLLYFRVGQLHSSGLMQLIRRNSCSKVTVKLNRNSVPGRNNTSQDCAALTECWLEGRVI